MGQRLAWVLVFACVVRRSNELPTTDEVAEKQLSCGRNGVAQLDLSPAVNSGEVRAPLFWLVAASHGWWRVVSRAWWSGWDCNHAGRGGVCARGARGAARHRRPPSEFEVDAVAVLSNSPSVQGLQCFPRRLVFSLTHLATRQVQSLSSCLVISHDASLPKPVPVPVRAATSPPTATSPHEESSIFVSTGSQDIAAGPLTPVGLASAGNRRGKWELRDRVSAPALRVARVAPPHERAADEQRSPR
jgi:hypothetical protein